MCKVMVMVPLFSCQIDKNTCRFVTVCTSDYNDVHFEAFVVCRNCQEERSVSRDTVRRTSRSYFKYFLHCQIFLKLIAYFASDCEPTIPYWFYSLVLEMA